MQLRNSLFRMSYNLKGRNEIKYFDEFIKTGQLPLEVVREFHFKKMVEFVRYCDQYVPYYEKLFKSIGFSLGDLKSIDDLNRLPVLKKTDIIENYSDFFSKESETSKKYFGSTGGSTGEPLKYFMSPECYERGVALMYRGWSYAGYDLGDKILMFAGSSLVGESSYYSKIIKWTRNFKSISSYGVSESDLFSVLDIIKSWRPKFLRGYASSIFLLADFIIQNKLNEKFDLSSIKAVFTTAEMLSDSHRNLIELCFSCKVYNQYGLNDGGISAFENGINSGFLIDTERAYLECVDEENINCLNKSGKLIASSFYNYAMPFLRYDTGDLGEVSIEKDNNESDVLVLKKLFGRATDFITINGKTIGSPVLTVLMGKVDVKKYQIIQTNESLRFIIQKGAMYGIDSELYIKNSIYQHLGNCPLTFDYSDEFILTKNKHKFIINKDEI